MTPHNHRNDPPSSDEKHPLDNDATRTSLQHLTNMATRQIINPFAGIAGASIALRQPNDDHTGAGQHLGITIYTPLNEGDASESLRRLEGYVRALQPGEMDRLLQLIHRVRGEADAKADDEEREEEKSDIERLWELLTDAGEVHEAYKARVAELEEELKQYATGNKDKDKATSELRRVQKLVADQNVTINEQANRIVKLKTKLKQQDAESENDKEKSTTSEKLRKTLKQKDKELDQHVARIVELGEELSYHRRKTKNQASALLAEVGDADDIAAQSGTGDESDAEDAHDEEGESRWSHGNDFEHDDHSDVSVNDSTPKLFPDGTESSEKPSPRGSTKKPASSLPTATPQHVASQHSRVNQQGPKSSNQSGTAKSTDAAQPPKDNVKIGTGMFLNGYTWSNRPAWSINEGVDIEKLSREIRRNSRAAKAQATPAPQTPADGASGPPAADEITVTPSGQDSSRGPGRKFSDAKDKSSKSKNVEAGGSDNNIGPDAESHRATHAKEKRNAGMTDGEGQPSTGKKTKHAPNLPAVEEESERHREPSSVTKGAKSISSDMKTKPLPGKQGTKRKVVQSNSEELAGGVSDPIYISSGYDTDSDTEDEHDVTLPDKKAKKAKRPRIESQ